MNPAERITVLQGLLARIQKNAALPRPARGRVAAPAPAHASRFAPPIRQDIPQAPRNTTGMLTSASECTPINIRAMCSTSAGPIFPPGWAAMVIIIAAEPVISAKLLLRSSVMRQTVGINPDTVNALSD